MTQGTMGATLAYAEAALVGGDLVAALRTCLADAKVEDCTVAGNGDDGQIWGAWRGGVLYDGFETTNVGARLRAETLQWLRVFAPAVELRVFRDPGGALRGVLAKEDGEGGALQIDREYPLIGAHRAAGRVDTVTSSDGAVTFAILKGRAGEVHAPPIDWGGGRSQRQYPRLLVRHYHDRKPGGDWVLRDTRWLRLSLEPISESESGAES